MVVLGKDTEAYSETLTRKRREGFGIEEGKIKFVDFVRNNDRL